MEIFCFLFLLCFLCPQLVRLVSVLNLVGGSDLAPLTANAR